MPKTEPIQRDPWAPWRGMALEAKDRLGLTLEEIAARLQNRPEIRRGYPGCGRRGYPSRQLVSKWMGNPGLMPLWAYAAINRILDIRAEEAREVCVVWR